MTQSDARQPIARELPTYTFHKAEWNESLADVLDRLAGWLRNKAIGDGMIELVSVVFDGDMNPVVTVILNQERDPNEEPIDWADKWALGL